MNDMADLEEQIEAVRITMAKRVDGRCRNTLANMLIDLRQRREEMVRLASLPSPAQRSDSSLSNELAGVSRPSAGISPDSAFESQSPSPTNQTKTVPRCYNRDEMLMYKTSPFAQERPEYLDEAFFDTLGRWKPCRWLCAVWKDEGKPFSGPGWGNYNGRRWSVGPWDSEGTTFGTNDAHGRYTMD